MRKMSLWQYFDLIGAVVSFVYITCFSYTWVFAWQGPRWSKCCLIESQFSVCGLPLFFHYRHSLASCCFLMWCQCKSTYKCILYIKTAGKPFCAFPGPSITRNNWWSCWKALVWFDSNGCICYWLAFALAVNSNRKMISVFHKQRKKKGKKTAGDCLLAEWLPFINLEHSQRCKLYKWCHWTAASASVCKSHNPTLNSCKIHFIFLDLSQDVQVACGVWCHSAAAMTGGVQSNSEWCFSFLFY